MTAITFDTHVFVKKLTGAGMPEAQAEILAAEQAALIEDKLATKRDLAEMEARLKAEITAGEQRMTIRLGGMMVVAVGAAAALVKLL